MIPAFNVSNVLPPYLGGDPTFRAEMSPYLACATELVRRFGTSPERIQIIDGLLRYREALSNLGIVDGFQWLDGSFVENVELRERRPPNDVDIVTYARRPAAAIDNKLWVPLVQANPHLFLAKEAKNQFKCDAYFVDMNKKVEIIVDDTRYWFGLFSHQRVSALWKGMVCLPLQSDDAAARLLI